MNRRSFSTIAALGVAALALGACSTEPKQPTITDIVTSTAEFSTLAAAVTAADLGGNLAAEGPLTVFAPRNSAFAALPAGALDELLLPENVDALRAVLGAHVVAGQYLAADLVGQTQTLTTIDGTPIIVDGTDGVTLRGEGGGAVTVVQPDIIARNGVIHVINGVLLP
jgi:uncharacterized surface protein with fasciclin (FAS1) repeats